MMLARALTAILISSFMVPVARAQEQRQAHEFAEVQRLSLQLAQENFRKLFSNSKKIVGVEVILAGPSNERVESFWGHVLLRFVDDDRNHFNDLVLSFVADIDRSDYSIWKAISGQYPVQAEILDLGVFMKTYVYGEGRYLERWPLQLKEAEIQNLIRVIQKRVHQSDRFGSYYFLGRNCASVVAGIFNQAGLPDTIHLAPPQAPNLMPRYLNMRGLAFYPPLRTLVVGWVIEEIENRYGVDYREIKRGQIPLVAFELLKSLDFNHLAQVFLFLPIENSPELYQKVAAEIALRRSRGQSVYWGLEKLPAIFYQRCETKDCWQEQVRAGREFWGRGFARAFMKQNSGFFAYNPNSDRQNFIQEALGGKRHATN